MYVTIHRGTQQIGGNLIEISTEKTRLLFDAGTNLPPLDGPRTEDDFELEGLTYGTPAFERVFLSHHHNDHCGLLKKLLPKIPVAAGSETKRILNVIADFTGQPRPDIQLSFSDREDVLTGDIKVTPILVKHSARDAYMFLIQADGQNVLYTGDFRTAETAISAVREALCENGRLNLIITEGTNIQPNKAKQTGKFQGEEWVARHAASWMRQYEGTVFVLCSAANEDRIQAISKAAMWSDRRICEDLFQCAVRGQIDNKSRRSRAIQRFVAHSVDQNSRAWPYFNTMHTNRELVSADRLAEFPDRNVIFVRKTMLTFMEKYMKARSLELEKSPVLIYSMWDGYRQTDEMQRVFNFCKDYGISVESLHTSGHADRETIQALIDGLKPNALLPIHCEAANRNEFLSLHENCLMAQDGERLEVPD